MTVGVVELETDDFAYAAGLLASEADGPLAGALRGTWTVLAQGQGMAGSDPAAVAWASRYDGAATVALNAAVMAIQSVEHLAAMFVQTARNYAAADAAATLATRRRLDVEVAALPHVSTFWLPACAPPPAAGGSGGGPPGWGLVKDAVGYVWPNGHQDRLRRAGGAWRNSAAALRPAAQRVEDAPRAAALHQLPEYPDMRTVCGGLAAHLRELADVLDGLGSACDELAHHLDTVHSEVIGELRSLLEWTAGIEATGAVLSLFTFGAAEAPTQAVEAARIARTATVVGACIERFVAAARLLAETVGGFVDRAAAVGARLRSLVQVPLLEPALAGVGPLRVLNEAREVQAAGRLASAGANLARAEKAMKNIDDPQLFEPSALRGLKLEDVRARIPRNWIRRSASHGDGEVYVDPLNKGRQIRVMRGYPPGSRPDPITSGPYVVVSQLGRKAVKIPLEGNPTLP